MTVYCIAQANLSNREGLAAYREKAPIALNKYNGSVVAASPNLISLEGEIPFKDMAVILSFPTEEDAKGWRDDPELAYIHELRTASGNWIVQLLALPK